MANEYIITADNLNQYDKETIPYKVRGMLKEEFNNLTDEQKRGLVVVTDEEVSGGTDSTYSIEEYDTNDGWHVRKHSDGFIEMWYAFNEIVATADWTAWGVLYNTGTGHFRSVEYPITLVKKYSETAEYAPQLCSAWICNEAGGSDSLTETGAYMLVRPNTLVNDFNACVRVHIAGNWK